MHDILIQQFNKVKKAIPLVEQRLNVKISFTGKRMFIKGEEFNEILTMEVIRAVNFGFDVEDALLLMNTNFSIQYINIKDCTKKKNLSEVRSRIIGKNGRGKGTIQELTASVIVLHENQVGIIADHTHVDSAIQAITSLARGSKHANVFAYLEKQNKERNKFDEEDLGLKINDKNQ